MLSPYRDRIAAKHFLQLTLWRVGHLRPRVINVDGHPAYPSAVAELKQTGELSKVCRCRPSPYLNNIIAVVPLRSRCPEYHPGIRSNEYDSKRTDPMVTEGRYRRSGPICESCLRAGCLMPASSPYYRLHSLICDTAHSPVRDRCGRL